MTTIEKLLAQQRCLAEFGSFAFRATDLASVLNMAARLCAESVQTTYCKVCRYRPEHNDLLIEAGHGWQPNVVGCATSIADATSPGGRAYVTRSPVICPDLAESNFVLPAFYQQHAIVSTANVIIQGSSDASPYGILELDDPNVRDYDQHDIDFLTSFANVVAEAVLATNNRLATERHLEERKVLARELQHRVRNNLHLIYVMLEREVNQRRGTDDPFLAIANRVLALATVYDHLLMSGSDELRMIPFGDYAARLCQSLRQFQAGKVKLVHGRMEPVPVDLDVATALGIALTEIISNSYKHAFPNQDGTIEVAVETRESVIAIVVEDDGIGLGSGANWNKRNGLGLAKRLAAQANGTLSVAAKSRGTRCEIIIPKRKE